MNKSLGRCLFPTLALVIGGTSGEITRADVGHFIVSALESHSYLGQTTLLSE